MKGPVSESIRYAYIFNLEQLSWSSRLAWLGILTMERLWKGFDSDAELFMFRTLYNVFCKQFDQNEHFSPFEFSSAGIKIGVWINSGSLNSLGRP